LGIANLQFAERVEGCQRTAHRGHANSTFFSAPKWMIAILNVVMISFAPKS
jgi:hypothetical protein